MAIRKSDDIANDPNIDSRIKSTVKIEEILERYNVNKTDNILPGDEAFAYLSEKIDECIDMLINHKLWQVNTIGKDMINNGAIQVIKRFVREHKGKVNYNGVVLTDWIDVHTIEDIRTIEQLWKDRT